MEGDVCGGGGRRGCVCGVEGEGMCVWCGGGGDVCVVGEVRGKRRRTCM